MKFINALVLFIFIKALIIEIVVTEDHNTYTNLARDFGELAAKLKPIFSNNLKQSEYAQHVNIAMEIFTTALSYSEVYGMGVVSESFLEWQLNTLAEAVRSPYVLEPISDDVEKMMDILTASMKNLELRTIFAGYDLDPIFRLARYAVEKSFVERPEKKKFLRAMKIVQKTLETELANSESPLRLVIDRKLKSQIRDEL